MRELYAWVPWFNELARTIAMGNERELAERASSIQWRENDRSSPLLKYGKENVDPFSFVYTVATHCRFPEGRARVTSSVGAVFGLQSKLPAGEDDAFYFPQGTPQNTLFHQRGQGNPGLLWELWRHALEGLDAVPGQIFENALRIGNVGAAKLTQALFLLDGREFMPYDGSSRPLLSGGSPTTPGWGRYVSAIQELRAGFPGCELYEINLFAYLVHTQRLQVGRGAFQTSTNVHGDGVDHWEDFDRNCWVYTGGPAPGARFDRPEEAATSNAYPLTGPGRGDIILVRNAGDGRGISIVWRNDYRQESTPNTRLHVLWLNKRQAPLGFRQQRGFSRAEQIEQAYRKRDEYGPTFALLDKFRKSDALSKEAILAALKDFDRRGREGFLQHYGYERARTQWILYADNKYDMKPIWRAAFGFMDGGRALTPEDEKFKTTSREVRQHLEDLGFEVIREFGKMDQPLNQILYGPPGTGKTWRTVDLALAIVDGKPESDHDLDRFDRLRFDAEVGTGNIAMVTFHQNFAYEDFVEGIRPMLDKGGQGLRYEIHEGLFKRLAEAAHGARGNASS